MVDIDLIGKAGGWYEYKGKKFRSYELANLIESNPEILQDKVWETPYYMLGGQFEKEEKEEDTAE